MTNQESIKGLQNLFSEHELTLPNTDSLEILQMAVAALEKQIPKKPAKGKQFSWVDTDVIRGRRTKVRKTSYEKNCPSCGNGICGQYCMGCGQLIDLSK